MASSNTEVRIREATEADARSIAEVKVRSWLKAYRGLMPDKFLDRLSIDDAEVRWRRAVTQPSSPASRVWVAERAGRVVGFAATGPTRDDDADPTTIGEVKATYLEPEAWGQGIGRALFQRCVEELRDQGFKAATLWVLETNVRTRLFYEAAGWRTDGAVKTDTVDDAELHEVRYRIDFP